MQRDFAAILDVVMESLHIDRPDAHFPIVGDACLLSGWDSKHDTHRDLKMVDVDYITLSGKGTQYGSHRENIWLDDNDLNNMVLDENKIDWWGNWQLVIRLHSEIMKIYHAGRPQIVMHEKVFEYINRHLTREEWLVFYQIVTPAAKKDFNHHTHIHLRFV